MRALSPERDLVRALNRQAFGPERERPGPGGVAHVSSRDTDRVSCLGRCWCGELIDHDWPGKADGDPHPR